MKEYLYPGWCSGTSDTAAQILSFAARALDRDRITRIDHILEEEHVCAAKLRQGLVNGTAPANLEADLAHLLGRLRGISGDRWIEATRRVDACLQSNRPELIDCECTPDGFKNLEVRFLDLQNRWFGNYKRFFKELERVATKPNMRLYDIASGRGGFYMYLAEQNLAPSTWELCASDLLAQPIAQGNARAQDLGLPVRFEQRDATNLKDLKGEVDLFTLQNAAHHFSPGLLLTVMHSAATSASSGIAIFDPVRSLTAAFMVLMGCILPLVTLINLHDALQSVRRCYSMAELVMLARVAGLDVQARFVAPMFNYVLVRQPPVT